MKIFKDLEDLTTYQTEFLENNPMGQLALAKPISPVKQHYWERMQRSSRPHEIHRTDLDGYDSLQWARTFLPYSNRKKAKGLWLYDGAELFKNNRTIDRQVFEFDENDYLISLINYTYPKGVLAATTFDKVRVGEHEVLAFMEVDELNMVSIQFRFGKRFREYIRTKNQFSKRPLSIDSLEQQAYQTNITTLQNNFQRELTHFDMMQFVLDTIGVSINSLPTNSKHKYFKRGYWTDVKGNVITNAFVGDSVQFHLITENIPDGEFVAMRLQDDDRNTVVAVIEDNKVVRKKEDGKNENLRINNKIINYYKVKNNRIVLQHKISDIIQNTDDTLDYAAELFYTCSYKNKHVDVPSSPKNYLKVQRKASGKISLDFKDKEFVLFGVSDFEKKKENSKIQLEIRVEEGLFNSFDLYLYYNNDFFLIKNLAYKKLQKKGTIITHDWDGFLDDGTFNSKWFTEGASIAVRGNIDNNWVDTNIKEIKGIRQEVAWVDVAANKKLKRIDITLRVHLVDGGREGITCDENSYQDPVNPGMVRSETVCPWHDIPQQTLQRYKKDPIKEATRSFDQLEKLALDGLSYHWGRNRNHVAAKNIIINGEKYEVFVNPVNTNKNTMDDVELIYNTNSDWLRSGNPGTVEDPISAVGNVVSREAICYNVGYIEYSNDWGYQYERNEDINYRVTSAHEIGHTILKAYGGTFYSYGHKGTVNTITQRSNSKATEHPRTGEIDIMPYYTDELSYYDYERYVAAEEDVKSLIWLTKLKLLKK
jgi:hypothetical protein